MGSECWIDIEIYLKKSLFGLDLITTDFGNIFGDYYFVESWVLHPWFHLNHCISKKSRLDEGKVITLNWCPFCMYTSWEQKVEKSTLKQIFWLHKENYPLRKQQIFRRVQKRWLYRKHQIRWHFCQPGLPPKEHHDY